MKNRLYKLTLPWLVTGLLFSFTPAFGAEELLYEQDFEDESQEIIATPDNNPNPSEVPDNHYVVISHHDDGFNNIVARRHIESDGIQVRRGGTLEGDYVFSFQDTNYDLGPQGSEFEGEDMNDRQGRLKFPNIDVEGYGNLRVELTIAAGFGAGNEPNDDIYIRTRVDGGDWIEVGGFKAPSSNNIPAYYEGPRDTVTVATNDDRLILGYFGDWDWPIYGHGSNLEVQVTAEGNAGNEDFHVGSIRVYGDTDTNFVSADFENDEVTEPDSGGVANQLTLTLDEPAPSGGVTFDLVPLDSRSAASLDIPASVTIPEGDTSVQVNSEIVQDDQYTGTKIVDLFVRAQGYNDGFARVLVDNVTPQPNIVITEVLNVVPGLQPEDTFGDANGDGVYHNTRDQFIEIVNWDDEPVDISGWRIGDDLADRHLIPDGTILAPDQVLVVFGGGEPQGTFGGATVQLPSGGGNGLGFNISSRAEVAYLNAQFNAEVDLVNIPLMREDQIAITQDLPDGHAGKEVSASVHLLSKDGPFDAGREYGADNIHSMIDGAEERLFSPGTWYDGTFYFDVENEISVSIDTDTISESDGAGAATGTISLSDPAPSGGLDVTLDTNGVTVHDDGSFTPDEIDLESLVVTVPEGATEANFTIDAYDDGVLDGDQEVSIFARGGTYSVTGFTSFTVEDVEESDLTVVINEIMSDVEETGTDYNLDGLEDDALGDQYLEVVNDSGRAVNLSGWRMTWDTGGTFAAERHIHTFPEGTWLPDGGAVVVFGSISAENAQDPVFNGALVQTARNDEGEPKKNGVDLRIDTTFDIKLFNSHGFLVDEIVEIDDDSINQGMALTRSPDISGELALHLEVSAAFTLGSAGAQIDGTPFSGNGIIWLPQTFVETILVDDETGWTYDPTFGWIAAHQSLTSSTPWAYSLNHQSYWYLSDSSKGGQNIWIYDHGYGGEWLYTNYIFYPWMYSHSSGQWFVRE